MKTKLRITIFALVLTGTSMLAQTSGGPDAYGYTWKNQAAAGGPVYNFKNIKGKGTEIKGLNDDNSVGPFNMNWNFHFYWNDYNKALIGANGWLSFTKLANISAPFPTIPNAAAPNNYIAAMLSDLTFTDPNNTSAIIPGASSWYWSNNIDSLIVQWDSVPFWVKDNPKYSGRNTFQIILSGVDSSITFQYNTISRGVLPYDSTGEGLKSGIENATGQIGLQIQNNTLPIKATAVKFYYPHPSNYKVYDVSPDWNQNKENGGFFVSGLKKAPIKLVSDISNNGNQPVGKIDVNASILDSKNSQVWTSKSSVASLSTGADSIITFPVGYLATAPETFTYRTTTTLTGSNPDMNAGNNVKDVEFIVVDTTQDIFPLSYTYATTATKALGFSGGGANTGGGVYIVPPFYPATIVSVDYYILQFLSTGGFTSKIVDDDGPNGTPLTVLATNVLESSTAQSWNNVPLSTPLVITSGGVYVSFFMYPDTSTALGVDETFPLSNRNYEILGGSWAQYRTGSAQDLMISANVKGSATFGQGINDKNKEAFTLSQNYPNPASTSTLINFNLLSSGEAQFSVRNMIGQELESINLGTLSQGLHSISLNTSKFASGIYFYTLKNNDNEVTKKMIINR